MAGPGKKSGKGPARRLLIFLDYLLAQTREAAHLLDDRYASVLTPGEHELREGLRHLTREVSDEARASAPWALVERLLRELGQG
jgi:hypothetical protein